MRKKEIVALVMVRVSSQYFPVLFEYHTVRKKDFVALARVRVSSQYFQFRIVYHTVSQVRDRGSRYG